MKASDERYLCVSLTALVASKAAPVKEWRNAHWSDRHGQKELDLNSCFHSRAYFKADYLFLLATFIVVVSLWIPRRAGPLDLRWDGAVYYVLGTAIAEGKGYRLLNEPGEVEGIQYPPLLPLLAAFAQTILGTSDPVIVGQWLKLFFFCNHAGFGLAAYLMLKLFFPRWLAFLGVLALLLNVQVIFHSNLFFSEIPFGLITLLFVLCKQRSSSLLCEALAALLAVMAFLLRTAGIALFAAWVVESMVKKQFKRAAFQVFVAGISVLSWNAYVYQVERSPNYTSPAYPYQRAPYLNHNVSYPTNLLLENAYSPSFRQSTAREMASRFWQNLLDMGVTLGEAVSESREYWQYSLRLRGQRFTIIKMISEWLFYVPLVMLGGLILGGMIGRVRQGDIFMPAYVAVSVILLCATPWPEQFRRYLTPVAPFLLANLLTCVIAIWNWLRQFRGRLVGKYAPFALLIVPMAIFDAEWNSLNTMYRQHLDEVRSEIYNGRSINYRLFYYNPSSKALDDGLDWLKKKAIPGEIVATSMPHWAYLRTGLKAVRPPLESNADRAQELLDSVPISYIVLNFEGEMQFVNESILPLVQDNSQAWKFVYGDNNRLVRIYERVREGNRRKEE